MLLRRDGARPSSASSTRSASPCARPTARSRACWCTASTSPTAPWPACWRKASAARWNWPSAMRRWATCSTCWRVPPKIFGRRRHGRDSSRRRRTWPPAPGRRADAAAGVPRRPRCLAAGGPGRSEALVAASGEIVAIADIGLSIRAGRHSARSPRRTACALPRAADPGAVRRRAGGVLLVLPRPARAWRGPAGGPGTAGQHGLAGDRPAP